MKIEKSELASKIEKLKNAVSKNDRTPAWQGILVKDGELAASSHEMTVRAKMDSAGGESFVIPAKMFDLIKNLPDGEMSIAADDKNLVTIKTGEIKNSFQSINPEEFPLPPEQANARGNAGISADAVKKAVRHVLYAVSKNRLEPIKCSVFLEAGEGKLNFVGLDGHMLAWDQIDFEGSFKLLIPRNAAEKILSFDMEGDIMIEFNENHAVFRSSGYEVYTRLAQGPYFPYAKMFAPMPVQTGVNRKELLDAVTRAKLSAEGSKVRFDIDEQLNISAKDGTADYRETVFLQKKVSEPAAIGFNPKLIIETLKAFECENVKIQLAGPKTPMIVEAEDSAFKAMVLPVAIN